jgi:regulator of replication initiation timing
VNPTLERAKELVDEIHEMTAALRFTGLRQNAEKEAEAYTAVMEERELLVTEMAALRDELDDTARKTPEFTAVMNRIAEIDALDKINQIYAEKLRDNMQGTIKESKTGRHISNAYEMGEVGGYSQYVDTKK